VVSVFLDFETFGEHHHPESGILDFLRALPDALRRSGVRMVTPTQAASRASAGTLSFPTPMSWADTERDTSAWLGNSLQQAAHGRLYALRDRVLDSGDAKRIEMWRRLSTSDHFYYMSTKWHADGDVHTYFNPHATPYDAYISFMNVMTDMERRSGKDRRSVARAPDRRKPGSSKNGSSKNGSSKNGSSKPATAKPGKAKPATAKKRKK
jgi:alpha-amylase